MMVAGTLSNLKHSIADAVEGVDLKDGVLTYSRGDQEFMCEIKLYDVTEEDHDG